MNDSASHLDLRRRVLDGLAAHEPVIRRLTSEIYEHPEVSGEEHLARQRCTEVLTEAGFDVTSVSSVETAFVAQFPSPSGRPAVGLLAEYDALPDIGHACGHHLIAGATVGAGLALASLGPALKGSVQVFGCPAEETLQGKRQLLEAGAFDRTDAALSFHAHEATTVMTSTMGLRELRFAFTGRPAHAASAPWTGASALDGVFLTMQNINALRQFVRDGVRVHGALEETSSPHNIVPERASCVVGIRATDLAELERVVGRVIDCGRAAALATDTEVQIVETARAEPVRRDPLLDRLARANLESLGEAVEDWEAAASTDFGDVSQVMPAVALTVATWPTGTGFHTHEATTFGGQKLAYAAMLQGARAIALTAIDFVACATEEADSSPFIEVD